MREWIDEISEYIEKKSLNEVDETTLPLLNLSEEIYQADLETDLLLQASNELQEACEEHAAP